MYSIIPSPGNLSKTKIRFIHAIPTDIPVDIKWDGKLWISNFRYTDNTPYMVSDCGIHELKILIKDRCIDKEVELQPGKSYTLVIHGSESDPKTWDVFGMLDDPGSTEYIIGGDDVHTYTRFIHMSYGTFNINIVLGGSPIIKIAYAHTPQGYVVMSSPDGIYSLGANMIISTNRSEESIIEPINISFVKNQYYSVFVVGTPDDPRYPMTFLLLRDSNSPVIHDE